MKSKLLTLFLIIAITLTLFAKKPKFIFLFIGDGMAGEQIHAAQEYLEAVEGKEKKLNILNFPVKGMTKTNAANFFITDSAAAGTAIATGYKTNLKVLGLDPSLKKELETVAERSRDIGMKVGIITTVSADQATPAAFYAHQSSRSNYYEIAEQLVESNFHFFGTGFLRYPMGRYDQKQNILSLAERNGYTIIDTQAGYEAFTPESSEEEKVWIINETIVEEASIPYSMDNTETFDIDDITQTAIDFLYNENGFFVMIEAGKVDWSCHANDAAAAIHDLIAFDRAVKHAVDFYERNPENTLVIVTGDHETGGLKTHFSGVNNKSDISLLNYQIMSQEAFTNRLNILFDAGLLSDFHGELLPEIEKCFGLYVIPDKNKSPALVLSETNVEQLKKAYDEFQKIKRTGITDYFSPYGEYNPIAVTCTHLLNKKAGLSWSTFTHTGTPVVTYALGKQQELFSGYYDNTNIAKVIFSILEEN